MRQPSGDLDIRRPRFMRGERRQAPSRWRRALPGVGLIAVLAATVGALYGTGQIGTASAADVGAAVHHTEHHAQAGGAAQQAQARQNGCTLIVPANPLSAAGLATPYVLTGSMGGVACRETNTATAAFVQAAVIDPATARISIYNPLVIDRGTRPAAAPITPTLPANAIVGIWFGSNANTLALRGDQPTTLTSANCVNGLGQSIFGQFSYCNAGAFFQTANQLIAAGRLTPPALGVGRDQMTCPTVRDFSVVDQDQSDNVTTAYRITQDGKLAQNTAANTAQFARSVLLTNGSDNGLLSIKLDGALGCVAWHAPDLADPGQMVTALPLDELQAAKYQGNPVALVPSGDPMVLVNGQPRLAKQNAYRLGVDQPAETTEVAAKADNLAYCRNVMSIAPGRLQQDSVWTRNAPSLDPATANSLFTFLAARLSTTLGPGQLNCTGLLGQPNPVHLMKGDGIVVDASFGAAPKQADAAASAAAAANANNVPATTAATTATAAPAASTAAAAAPAAPKTVTPTNTPKVTPKVTPPSTPTNTPPSTPTATPTSSPTPVTTPTSTPTNTPTSTPTSTPSSTPSSTPTNTPTSTPSSTPTSTPSSTPATGAGAGTVGG